MKEAWETKPFKECIDKVTYTTKIQRQDFLEEGAFPIVSQEKEIINGYWDDEADVFEVATPLVIFGDHTKVLKYVDFDFVLGADGVKLLQPRDFLLPKFFFYQLQMADLDSLGYARHYKLLKGLDIAYPSPSEQQRIVAILDEAFDGIATAKANAEKNLQNARALFEGFVQTVFAKRGNGWTERPIAEIAKHSLGKMLDRAKNQGEMKPYLRNLNVRWFSFDLGDLLEMRFTPTESDKYRAIRGDVLICDCLLYTSPSPRD